MREAIYDVQTGETTYRDYTAEEIAAFQAEMTEQFRAGAKLSFAQMLIGLVSEEWITEAEGRSWRDRQGVPAPVQALIASLPVEQQFAAETRAIAPSVVLRTDPLVIALAAMQGKTPEELDTFFTTYAEV
jgi:hypothetical protein